MVDAREKPMLAVTLGDPAGIGPEVMVGAWSDAAVHERCCPLAVGHPEILRRAVRLLDANIQVVEIDTPEEAMPSVEVIPCLPVGADDALEVVPGSVTSVGGQAAHDALVVAAELALAKRVDGITTSPLSKAALWKAGYHFPGHTELLGWLCGADDIAMMLYLPPGPQVAGPAGLGVVHATLHMALRDVPGALSTESILAKCRLVHETMTMIKGTRPCVAVCALNPHAGEDELFGQEEAAVIRPAIEQAAADGIDAVGPLPADTLMMRAAAGEFDAVVAMYHDQGHIPLKLLAAHQAVNVTLGLPIVRTSVAHGTAGDRAWQGTADAGGMVAALTIASDLARHRSSKLHPRRQTAAPELH